MMGYVRGIPVFYWELWKWWQGGYQIRLKAHCIDVVNTGVHGDVLDVSRIDQYAEVADGLIVDTGVK